MLPLGLHVGEIFPKVHLGEFFLSLLFSITSDFLLLKLRTSHRLADFCQMGMINSNESNKDLTRLKIQSVY